MDEDLCLHSLLFMPENGLMRAICSFAAAIAIAMRPLPALYLCIRLSVFPCSRKRPTILTLFFYSVFDCLPLRRIASSLLVISKYHRTSLDHWPILASVGQSVYGHQLQQRLQLCQPIRLQFVGHVAGLAQPHPILDVLVEEPKQPPVVHHHPDDGRVHCHSGRFVGGRACLLLQHIQIGRL